MRVAATAATATAVGAAEVLLGCSTATGTAAVAGAGDSAAISRYRRCCCGQGLLIAY